MQPRGLCAPAELGGLAAAQHALAQGLSGRILCKSEAASPKGTQYAHAPQLHSCYLPALAGPCDPPGCGRLCRHMLPIHHSCGRGTGQVSRGVQPTHQPDSAGV